MLRFLRRDEFQVSGDSNGIRADVSTFAASFVVNFVDSASDKARDKARDKGESHVLPIRRSN
jgi:hypothetical protein